VDLTLTPTHLDRLAEVAWTWAAAFLPRLVAAVLILVIGTIVARWVSRAVYNISQRTTTSRNERRISTRPCGRYSPR